MTWTRLGVYGGTFNPIHTGHLVIAQEVYEQFQLDCILFIPSARPPHKQRLSIVTPEHRYAMTCLATNDDPRFAVSDLELHRPGMSYTVETLRDLRQRHGEACQLYFVIGADSLLEIGTWREPENVFQLSTVVVVPRPGIELQQAPLPWRDRVVSVHSPRVEISSTDIRRRIEQGRSIRYLVPPRVEEYIHIHGLYRTKKVTS